MSNALQVTVDKNKFYADVNDLLNGTTVWAQVKQMGALKWPDALKPPQIFTTFTQIAALLDAIISAVEIVKQNAVKMEDPDGSKGLKFDNTIALETAAKILDDTLVFDGFAGSLIEKVDGPLMNLLISIAVSAKPADWFTIAKTILGLV
jgi:hypothetical protein